MRSTHTSSRGFTLIELLVVVAIIALLIAILIPSLASARRRAKNVACGENLHGIGRALHTYATEYEGLTPVMPDNTEAFSGQGPLRTLPHASFWINISAYRGPNGLGFLIPSYLPTTKFLVCRSEDTTAERLEQTLSNYGKTSAPDGIAFSSYLYRNLGQTTNNRLWDLGTNETGGPALALVLDFLSNTTVEPHMAHDLKNANVLYRDGSVHQARNTAGAFLFTDVDTASNAAVVKRYSQLFVNADFSLTGEPQNAPQLP